MTDNEKDQKTHEDFLIAEWEKTKNFDEADCCIHCFLAGFHAFQKGLLASAEETLNIPQIETIVAETLDDAYALREMASTMNVREFAEKLGKEITLWGQSYSCVKIRNIDFLWNLTDGKFDGWERHFHENEEQ